jgi:DNA-binding beta-propeller fold protein YncE
VLAWRVPLAFGADSIYWTDYFGAIRVGNLDGSGSPANLGPNFTGEFYSQGLAIDPAAGKIYWTRPDLGAIRVGNLDGSGSPANLGANYTGETSPHGLAIDAAAGTMYWADGPGAGTGAIRVGNLDGGLPPGNLGSNYASETIPVGVAIDPAAGKIYWADSGLAVGTGAIRVGNLDGSGTPQTLFSGENFPAGVAIDPAAGKIYWSNTAAGAGTGAIRVGNLDGRGLAANLGANYINQAYPFGVAIDPAAGKIYWADPNLGAIRVGNLDGSGAPNNLGIGFGAETTAPARAPLAVALLRAPAGTASPIVSGGSRIGSVLSCSRGAWAPDLLGAFLYRAPRSFAYQWSFDGSDIQGATANSFTASAPGSYACRVTASNDAGSGSQTSAVHAVTGAAVTPRLTSVSQSHPRWRRGSALPQVASVRSPTGTTFRFTLNELARVRFRFTEELPGRRVVTAGSLSFSAGAGAHDVRFQGRLSKRKKLKPGRYTLIITASNSAGRRATAKLMFVIVSG